MSFEPIEISNDQGRPIFLYAFTLGDAVFRYTSSDEDQIIGGYNWAAVPISDDGVRITGEAKTDGLQITAPASIAPVIMFQTTPPSQTIAISIYHYHEGDNQAVLGYTGDVMQVNQPEPGKAVITCDTISTSMQRDGLRLAWQRTCGYALYDQRTCKADKAAKELSLVVYEKTANTIQFQGLDAVDDGYLDGGFIEWSHPTRGREFRSIETQVGNVVTMFGLADGLYYGLSVKAYPGCNRTMGDCTNKFNNLPNYGGVPDMPGKSPFDGDPVF